MDLELARTKSYALVLRTIGHCAKIQNPGDTVLIPDFISTDDGTNFLVRLAQSDVTRSLLEGIYLLLRKKYDPEKQGLIHVTSAPEGPHGGNYESLYDLVIRRR
jgi:hypothetical protein